MRYVQPLREGGSLPAVVDTDGGLFVVKFRGAGQGAKALVAELVVGLLAQEAGFPVPELALVVAVQRAFFHCGRCITASRLWESSNAMAEAVALV